MFSFFPELGDGGIWWTACGGLWLFRRHYGDPVRVAGIFFLAVAGREWPLDN